MNNRITAKEFHVTFALSKTKMFNVSYYTLGSNNSPYFSTSADIFNRPKTDWSQCGQCQKEVLKGYLTAMKFYKKWDEKHLKQLTDEEYQELISDIEELFNKYPHILEQQTDRHLEDIRFNRIKDFSMTVYRKKAGEI